MNSNCHRGLDIGIRRAKLPKFVTLQDHAMITVTSVEAQENLSQLLDTAQREPVIIMRHGRPAAYMISPQDMFDTSFGSFADEHSSI
jgi:prevent-host-death family protein